jgi:hypothetical protein
MLLGFLQALLDEIKVGLWGLGALFRFFLEAMKNINAVLKFGGVHPPRNASPS